MLDCPTPEMLHYIEKMLPRSGNISVEVFIGKFSGPARARNEGLKGVTTPFIAFWDSDDQPDIEKIVRMVNETDLNRSSLIIGGFEILTNGSTPRKFRTSSLTQVATNPGLWRCLVSTSLLNGITFPDLRLGEDQVFLAKILESGPKVIFKDEILYRYHYGGFNQLTSTRNFNPILQANHLTRIIGKTAKDKEIRKFLVTLQIKQLLTLLLRGNYKVKSIATIRIFTTIYNSPKFSINAIRDIFQTPTNEKFNV